MLMKGWYRRFPIIDSATGMIGLSYALIWLITSSTFLLVYLLSYTVHLVNLHAYLFRSCSPSGFLRRTTLFRSIAWGVLIWVAYPHVGETWNATGLAVIATGVVLHTFAFLSLGGTRTFYGVELGAIPAATVDRFPYGVIPHPMAIGCALEFYGVYLLCPPIHEEYPGLIFGHVGLTLLTATVEQFGWHFRGAIFRVRHGAFVEPELRATVDRVREWTLQSFQANLGRECSMHRYVKSLPTEVIGEIDRLRYAAGVLSGLREVFPGSVIVPMPMTDELYLSRYNYDGGGDQGLFDKHHDGNLRFMPGASVIRSLIYLSSDDRMEVVFESSGQRRNFKTYEFGLLDFHRELHWVDGSFDPESPPRILLKCNYYIDHTSCPPYRWLGFYANVVIFYIVKAAMEYSKSPRTAPQRLIGGVCNLFRRLNNLSPVAPVAVAVAAVAFSVKAVLITLSL